MRNIFIRQENLPVPVCSPSFSASNDTSDEKFDGLRTEKQAPEHEKSALLGRDFHRNSGLRDRLHQKFENQSEIKH